MDDQQTNPQPENFSEEEAARRKQSEAFFMLAVEGLQVFNKTMYEHGVPPSAIVAAQAMTIGDMLGGTAVANDQDVTAMCRVLNQITTDMATRAIAAHSHYSEMRAANVSVEAIVKAQQPEAANEQ